jgi:dsRNA-specific ribonuclease
MESTTTNTNAWLKKLQLFLAKLLSPVVDNVKDYITKDAMVIWATAFTHETFSENNYEELEFMGDAILKVVFSKYLMRKNPKYNKKDLTELNVAYMSKMYNGLLSRKMGLGNFIRARTDKPVFNLEADVFESFFGALDAVSDMIFDGTGTAVCYNMIVYLFRDVTLNIEKTKGSDKTLVQQIFGKFNLPPLIEDSQGYKVDLITKQPFLTFINKNVKNPENKVQPVYSSIQSNKKTVSQLDVYSKFINDLKRIGVVDTIEENKKVKGENVSFSITLNKQQLQFLKNNSIDVSKIKNGVLATAYEPTKAAAENLAYKTALQILKDIGVTPEWAEKVKRDQDFEQFDVQTKRQFKKIIKEMGFDDAYFFVSRKTTNEKGSILQLIGRRQDGSTKILGSIETTETESSYKTAKAQLVTQFISKH